MTVEDAKAIVNLVRSSPLYGSTTHEPGPRSHTPSRADIDYDKAFGYTTRGGYSPSPRAILSGGPSPNDLIRAKQVLMGDILSRNPGISLSEARMVYRDGLGGYFLDNAIDVTDPMGKRGATRQLEMDSRRSERARRPAAAPRTSPGPPPETGMYDRLGRRYNPSFRGSRAFHGTLPQATGAALRHPVLGKGMSRAARQVARMTAAKGILGSLPVVGPLADYALDTESRSPTQFLRGQEEFFTGLPGLVSPSELPPPAVLPPDRLKAVEATQGMAGVAPDTKSPNVTEQEVRAYISNKVAKGDKLPAWAEKITSMKGGRLSIKPVNPRAKARQEAAAPRPHNPRMGQTKRKYGSY